MNPARMIDEPGKTTKVSKGKFFCQYKKGELMVYNVMGEWESEYAYTVWFSKYVHSLFSSDFHDNSFGMTVK